MIWPFKKRERVLPFEEFVALQPMPPCGNPLSHYGYELNNVPCIPCMRKRRDDEDLARDRRLADMIADAVVDRLVRMFEVER